MKASFAFQPLASAKARTAVSMAAAFQSSSRSRCVSSSASRPWAASTGVRSAGTMRAVSSGPYVSSPAKKKCA
jgi:hypothetical protein